MQMKKERYLRDIRYKKDILKLNEAIGYSD